MKYMKKLYALNILSKYVFEKTYFWFFSIYLNHTYPIKDTSLSFLYSEDIQFWKRN